MKRKLLLMSAVFFIALLSLPHPLMASEPEPGVARVSLINGALSTMRGDSGDWVASTINAPIVQGDKIATGKGSRAEIQLDHANILRMDQQAEVRIASLTHNLIQVQVSAGQVSLTVLKGNDVDIEVDTPNVAVRPLSEGSYRVLVLSDSESQLIVRDGEADVSTAQGSTQVKRNELITIRGQDNPEYQVSQAPGLDAWDEWNGGRDHAIEDAQSWRYTNNYYTGTQDLDNYGHWVWVPGYDWVWSPYADADWAPYRSGRWCWEPYWGWTWVSYEPWGWAPYHYGRWFWHDTGWCWWPGPVFGGYRPIWAPAYVSFFGFGFGGRHSSFGFGFGFNSIGWLPVGPCDAYYPWWGHRNSYNVVNVTNITNIRNFNTIQHGGNGGLAPLADWRQRPYYSNLQTALRDPHGQRGLTAVSTENFIQNRIDQHTRIRDGISLREAQLVQGTVPAVPNRASLRPVDRAVNRASLPTRTAGTERFFSKRPVSAGPQPFSQRAAEIRRMVQTRDPLAAPNGTAGTARELQSGALRGTTMSNAGPSARSGASAVPGLSNQRNLSDRPPGRSVIPNQASREALRAPAASTMTSNPSRTTQGSDLPGRQQFSREAPADRGRVSVREGGIGNPAVSDRFNRGSSVSAGAAASRGNSRMPAESRGGWERFNNRPQAVPSRPANRGFGYSPSSGERSRPTWDRFPSQSGGSSMIRNETRPSYRPEASIPRSQPRAYESSRSYQRPPLQMSKPIVTERGPRGSDGGGRSVSRGGSAPSSARSAGRGHR